VGRFSGIFQCYGILPVDSRTFQAIMKLRLRYLSVPTHLLFPRLLFPCLVFLCLVPGLASAQVWKVAETFRTSGPAPGEAFRGSPEVAVGRDGDYYVLDGRAKLLYRFDALGSLLWQSEVPTQPNPMLTMLRDTAALRQMASAFLGDSGMRARVRDTTAAARKRTEAITSLAGAVDISPDVTVEKLDKLSEQGIFGKVIALSEGAVAVSDMISRQTSVFDSTGRFLRSDGGFSLMETAHAWAGLGSRVVASTQSMSDMMSGLMNGGKSDAAFTVRMMPTSSEAGREIARMQMPPMVNFDGTTMRMRTEPPLLLMASSGDRLFVASNEHYSITMYDIDGRKVGTIGRRVARKPVTAADRMRTTREFAQQMDSLPPAMRERIKFKPEMGDSLPAITSLAAGDSLVFVHRGSIVSRDAAPQPAKTSRWDVLGWDNTYRGYLDMPIGTTIVGARNGRLYGMQRGPGSASSVVVWTLTPPPGRAR
jgi:hypothetical protein